jgi:transcriptional regulator with XRE-family HTH domain
MPKTPRTAAQRTAQEKRRQEFIAIRQSLAISKAEMARRMDADKTTYGAWEAGINGISPQVLHLARLVAEQNAPAKVPKQTEKLVASVGRPRITVEDARVQKAKRLRQQGLTLRAIAQQLQVAQSAVSRWLKL